MSEVKYTGQTYRLRSGTPMPVENAGRFVLHTFMAEVSDIEMFSCTEDLPASDEFRGQGGDLMSASFSRLNIAGGKYFQGKKIYQPCFADEDAIYRGGNISCEIEPEGL